MVNFANQSLEEIRQAVVADGVIDADEAAALRQRLFADGVIDRDEADFLFAVNDAVSGNNNDPAWKTLFVDALSAHVLGDVQSPNVLDQQESAYLIDKIGADGKVDDAEIALLVNLCAQAKDAPETFHDYVLDCLKRSILEDGVIDDAEVQLIRRTIYGQGGSGGQQIDRKEADFLFDLNDATSGKPNTPGWKTLFVEAIASHLLEDEQSLGRVDDQEADWLIGRIQGDQQVDENEKSLLAQLCGKASSLPDRLQQLLASRR